MRQLTERSGQRRRHPTIGSSRSIAVTAAKLGALAIVRGLAYETYQNYRNGQSPEASRNIVPEAAPGRNRLRSRQR